MLRGISSKEFKEMHNLKRLMISLRKLIAPAREVVNPIIKGELESIDERNLIFYKDVYDHIVQAVDMLDVQRDILTDLSNVHISLLAQKTNDVMKVLTIIATIFIPLTFVVGVYGMNFKYLPELEWRYGYFYVWILMLAIVLCMLRYFRKQKWM